MFNIVLYEPEIPPNTGNIIRLCANTGCLLHLVEPLGFELDDKRMRRAGLDYAEWEQVLVHANWNEFLEQRGEGSIYGFTTHGQRYYQEVNYQPGDYLLFGPETRGLPESVRDGLGQENCLRVPMLADSRSLNLSNTAAIAVYEAWRQSGFKTGS